MAYRQHEASISGFFEAGLGVLMRNWLWLAGGVLAPMAVQLALAGLTGQAPGAGMMARPTMAMGAGLLAALGGILAFAIHIAVTRHVLSAEGLVREGTPVRWAAYIGVSFVTALLAGLASVLFLVPGVMLMLRWYLAGYFTLARGMGVSEAMEASRDATKGHRWALFFTLVLLGVVALVIAGGQISAAGGLSRYIVAAQTTRFPGVGALVANVLLGLAFWSLNLGIFGVLAAGSEDVSEVFA